MASLDADIDVEAPLVKVLREDLHWSNRRRAMDILIERKARSPEFRAALLAQAATGDPWDTVIALDTLLKLGATQDEIAAPATRLLCEAEEADLVGHALEILDGFDDSSGRAVADLARDLKAEAPRERRLRAAWALGNRERIPGDVIAALRPALLTEDLTLTWLAARAVHRHAPLAIAALPDLIALVEEAVALDSPWRDPILTESILALGEMGPAARPAVPTLEHRFPVDDRPYLVSMALRWIATQAPVRLASSVDARLAISETSWNDTPLERNPVPLEVTPGRWHFVIGDPTDSKGTWAEIDIVCSESAPLRVEARLPWFDEARDPPSGYLEITEGSVILSASGAETLEDLRGRLVLKAGDRNYTATFLLDAPLRKRPGTK